MQIRRFIPGEEAALYEVYYSAIHQVASRDYTVEQIEVAIPNALMRLELQGASRAGAAGALHST